MRDPNDTTIGNSGTEDNENTPKHHVEQHGSKTVIRNPTKEEIDTIEKEKGIFAEPAKKPKTKASKLENYSEEKDCVMKPRVSDFEPKAVEFFLPSGTKIVKSPGVTERGSIYIRRLTTVEESIIQNTLLREVMSEFGVDGNKQEPLSLSQFLILLNQVINPCIRSDVDIKELAIIDKLPLIVKLISLTYGKDITPRLMCPACEKYEDVTIDLEKDIIISHIPNTYDIPRKITLKDSFDFEVDVYITIPLIADEQYFIGSNIDVLKQFEVIVTDASGTKLDGTAITKKDLGLIVDNLGDDDKKKLREFVSEYSKFGTDLTLKPLKFCKNSKGRCKMANEKVSDMKLPLQTLLSRMM